MTIAKKIDLEKIKANAEKIMTLLAKISMKNYLDDENIKAKPWHKMAVESGATFSVEMLRVLQEYQKKIVKVAKSNKIFVTENAEEIQKAEKTTEEYLDADYNRVIDPDIRDVLAEMETAFVDACKAIYIQHMETLTLTATDTVLKHMGLEINFNAINKATKKYLKEKVIRWAKQVNGTTQKAVKKALVEGYDKGLSEMDTAKLIEKNTEFGYTRAELVARTETMAACNYADSVAYSLNDDIIAIRWVTSKDDRVRKTHRTADGQQRPKGEPFIIGGYKMMYPGDSSLGAAAKEVVNCRCIIQPVFKEMGEAA